MEQIIAGRDALIASICAFSKSQVELWRQVPWLALQADGRDGGMGSYARAYREGLWAVHGSDPISTTFVDCDTGSLVRLSQRQSNNWIILPAWDDKVLHLATRPNALNAASVISMLVQLANSPRRSYITEEQALERDAKRREIELQYSLSKVYARTPAAHPA